MHLNYNLVEYTARVFLWLLLELMRL